MIITSLHTPRYLTLAHGFEELLRNEGKSEDYVELHIKLLHEFLCYCEENGITEVKSFTQKLVDEFIYYLEHERRNKRNGGPLDESTISRHKVVIRHFWRYLAEEGIRVSPIYIQYKRRKKRKLPTVLTREEIRLLYSVCDDSALGYRDRCMLGIFFGCGMRKSEGLRLLVSDIDFSRGRIHVRKSKNNRERYVVMSPQVQSHIEEYVYNYRDMYLPEGSPYEEVFISQLGRPTHGISLQKRLESLWQRVKEQYSSEKHIGLHTLRHTLGSLLYQAGMSVEMIALMLGHRSLEATQLYIQIVNQQQL